MKHTITEYLDRRFSEMEDDGFSLLAQVPSSEAKRFLSGYAALSGVQRALFRKAATARGALWWGFEYDRGAKTPDAQFFDEFSRMTPYPDDIHSFGLPRAKAPELRRVAHLAFDQLLASRPQKSHEPGDWHYSGRLLGEEVSIQIRYATRMGQLVYGLNVGEARAHHSFCFEQLFSFGIGAWDLISVSDIDRTFAVLKDVISAAVRDYQAIHRLCLKNA